jgi:MFS family permease
VVLPRRRHRLTPDARRIVAVQALRAFAYGLGSVLVGVSLERRGLSVLETGVVLTAILAGAAAASAALVHAVHSLGRRTTYLLLLSAMGGAGAVFATTDWLPALVAAALTGTVSTDVVESGPFTSLEQAMLPLTDETGTPARLFATYNTVATTAGSLGALAAGGPTLTHEASAHWLLAYPVAALLALPVAGRLSPAVEQDRGPRRTRPRPTTSPIIRRLAALFALDSFGGGFVPQTLIAYLLARRYGASAAQVGLVFFGIGLLQAVSFQLAGRIAGRIGLVRTMVFTHLPSNVLLAAVGFAPDLWTAVGLLLARHVLSQMDVPVRQALVVTVVEPDERTAAAAYTNAARYTTRPLAPLLAGVALRGSLGAPFAIAGALKAAYDVALYAFFRRRLV